MKQQEWCDRRQTKMIKLPVPVVCECGFATIDAKEAVRHIDKHWQEKE